MGSSQSAPLPADLSLAAPAREALVHIPQRRRRRILSPVTFLPFPVYFTERLSALGGGAAVDGQCRAGDEGRLVTEQVGDVQRDLADGRDPAGGVGGGSGQFAVQ